VIASLAEIPLVAAPGELWNYSNQMFASGGYISELAAGAAIGVTDRDVLTVFLIEAGLVGLTGGLAGVALSYFLQNLINEAVRNIPADGGGGVMFLPFDLITAYFA
jgi:ABC-type lipoprotein release transport system permease subunit